MKVFISYSHSDKDKALQLRTILIQNEFEVLGDFNLQPGDTFEKTLSKELLNADAIVLLITSSYMKSAFCQKEIHSIETFINVGSKARLIPVVFDERISLPAFLHYILYIKANDNDIDNTNKRILASLLLYKKETEDTNLTIMESVTVSSAIFINDSLQRLNNNLKINRVLSFVCYISAFICLVITVIFSWIRANEIYNIKDLQLIVTRGILGILTLVLILTLSRFLFILGKSFMVEAIRNSDRIHAISFGEFYLKAYGTQVTREEVREVFGNWNIDYGSSFITQSPKDYDPQLLENVISSLTALKGTITK